MSLHGKEGRGKVGVGLCLGHPEIKIKCSPEWRSQIQQLLKSTGSLSLIPGALEQVSKPRIGSFTENDNKDYKID